MLLGKPVAVTGQRRPVPAPRKKLRLSSPKSPQGSTKSPDSAESRQDSWEALLASQQRTDGKIEQLSKQVKLLCEIVQRQEIEHQADRQLLQEMRDAQRETDRQMALLYALLEKQEAQREADQTEVLRHEAISHDKLAGVMAVSLQAVADGMERLTAAMPEMVRRALEKERELGPISTSTPRTTPRATRVSGDSTTGWSRKATAGTSEEVSNSQTSVGQGQTASRSQGEAQWSDCARAEYRTAPSLFSS